MISRLINGKLSANSLFQYVNIVIKPFSTKLPSIRQQTVRNFAETRPYDVNTNVAKDVILFKYENQRFFRILNIFGISQFIFWTYISAFAYTTLKDAPVAETKPGEPEPAWYQKVNLGDNKYRNGITIISFLLGKSHFFIK